MKIGAEDRKKLIAAGSFGVLALGYLGYTLVGNSGGTDSAPATPTASVGAPAARPNPHATPSRLDPALHPEGMLLTESLVYSGRGRNIFAPVASQVAAATPVKIPTPMAPARYVPPANTSNLPPPAPPIELRFFGTETRPDGKRQAFFLRGDDVLVAATGDVVSRRYRVGTISANSVEVTDLTNNNTQRIPMSPQ